MATVPRNKSAMKYAQDVVALHDDVRESANRLDDFISIGEDLLAMEKALKSENASRPKGQEKIRWIDFRRDNVERKGCDKTACQAYVAIAIAANGYRHPGDSDKDEEPHLEEAKQWALDNGKNIGVGARGLYEIILGYKKSLKPPKEKKEKVASEKVSSSTAENGAEEDTSEVEALREKVRLLEIENQRLKDELVFKTGAKDEQPKDEPPVLEENDKTTIREDMDAAMNADKTLADRWERYKAVLGMAESFKVSVKELAKLVEWPGNQFHDPIDEAVRDLNSKLQSNEISNEEWAAALDEIAVVTKETIRDHLDESKAAFYDTLRPNVKKRRAKSAA